MAVADPAKRPDADVIDYYIGTSRDCKTFDRSWIYAGKPFIERGPDGSFDKAMLQPSSQIITRGDEHFIYYTGQYSQHHAPKAAQTHSGRIGLAKLPLDRFVAQQAGDRVGTILTKPFRLEGSSLQVNVDARDGRVQVEILDAECKPIPGFAGENSRLYRDIDELRMEAQWEDHRDLSILKGKTIRLKFHLCNAKLYAFQVNPKE